MTTTDPTPLAEQIAREHVPIEGGVTRGGAHHRWIDCLCGTLVGTTAGGRSMDAVRAAHRVHVATVTERGVRDEFERRIEAFIRHGESVPADVTTYDRATVHSDLRSLIATGAPDA